MLKIKETSIKPAYPLLGQDRGVGNWNNHPGKLTKNLRTRICVLKMIDYTSYKNTTALGKHLKGECKKAQNIKVLVFICYGGI